MARIFRGGLTRRILEGWISQWIMVCYPTGPAAKDAEIVIEQAEVVKPYTCT